MNRADWSERRRAWWRRGWTALVTGVLLCPVTSVSECADVAVSANGVSQCHTSYIPLLGMVVPLVRYKVY